MSDRCCPACGKDNPYPTVQFMTAGKEGETHGGMVYVCTCGTCLGSVEAPPPVSPRPKPAHVPVTPEPREVTQQALPGFEFLAALAAAPQDANVVVNAKRRLKLIKAALKCCAKLRRERDSLERLIAAAKQHRKPKAAATVGRVSRLAS